MMSVMLYAVSEGIATITFNRPAVMNALDADMIRAFRAACERATGDSAVRVIVLRGAGPGFVAGGDVAMFRDNVAAMAALVPELAAELHHGILALRRAQQPVIAAVHGAVAGAGVSIMLACDLVLAAAGTQFSLAYSRIGTSPDGGATWFLPRLTGYQKAMELMLLADTVDAETMQGLGVVNRVIAVDQWSLEVEKLARRLAAGPARAYAETKALANRALLDGLAVHLDAEALAFARCAAAADFAEGVTAFADKRKPLFKGK
ncbi:MAG: enoyl-CoA hydratase-related protein [Betaproteobacteria bacterium]|mgnify:CR=1 FL=1